MRTYNNKDTYKDKCKRLELIITKIRRKRIINLVLYQVLKDKKEGILHPSFIKRLSDLSIVYRNKCDIAI